MNKYNGIALVLPTVAILFVAAIRLAMAAHPVQAVGDPIVVIVNKGQLRGYPKPKRTKKIWLSDKTHWDSGIVITPVMLAPGAPERTAFLKIVCGMNDADFSKYFLRAAFTGKSARPPKEWSSSREVKGVVGTSPGAIGFVKALDFHGDGSDGGVKAMKIDGIAAGDSGYKLRM